MPRLGSSNLEARIPGEFVGSLPAGCKIADRRRTDGAHRIVEKRLQRRRIESRIGGHFPADNRFAAA
ncbi:MAG: hypothetical protein A49_06880 [Methyloceanibacter sp.]|nr:MAG: hypothetical protein A49_06880 [Methyloceanibacter sp.]